MPVSIQTLQESARPLGDRVLEFLQSHPDQGYGLLEIFQAIENYSDAMVLMMGLLTPTENAKLLNPFRDAIEKLQTDGLIRKFEYRGQTYFGIVPR